MEGLLELEGRRRGPSWLRCGPDVLRLSPLASTPLPYDVEVLELTGEGREAVDQYVEIELVSAFAK